MSLSDWGSLASLLGLFLTGWALWEIRRLRRFYVFKARVPELLEKLSEHASALASCLNDFRGLEAQASEELARLEATLKSLKPKLHGDSKRSTMILLSNLRARGEAPSEEGIRQVYLSVIKVVEEVKNLREDLEWLQR